MSSTSPAAACRRASSTWDAVARRMRWTCCQRSSSRWWSGMARSTSWSTQSAMRHTRVASATAKYSLPPCRTPSACAPARGETRRCRDRLTWPYDRERPDWPTKPIIHSAQSVRRSQELTPEDAKQVSDLIKKNNIQIVDLKFNDLPGLWQHFSMPFSELTELDDLTTSIWVEGVGFDGSSIRGFQKIQESDMILIPDPSPPRQPTGAVPRYIARKAEEHLKSTGLADTSYWGPEAEFFIFDDVRFDQTENCGYYYIDSVEGEWNRGREEKPNLGYKPRFKEGYFPAPPHDSLQDLRSETS